MTSNQAAWLEGKGSNLVVNSAPTYKAGPDEIVIQNKAIAINPVDWKIQDSGFMIEKFPAILGCDAAGIVQEVGSNVKNFKAGDRVAVHAIGLALKDNKYYSFQEYTVALAKTACILPSNITFEAGSAFPLSVSTASHGLYAKDFLGLPYPSTDVKSSGKALLIWGAASSVGLSAVQLAHASGLEVVTTSSARNFDLLTSLGASKTFDYTSPSVVGDIVAYLKDKTVAGAFDAFGSPDAGMQTAQILAQLGGGFIADVLPPPEGMPATVSGKWIMAPTIFLGEPTIGDAVWGSFLPSALESGKFKPVPAPKVVGKGLDKLQEAMNQHKQGVSASKLVVTL